MSSKPDIHFKINLRKELQDWAPDTANFLRGNIRKKKLTDKRMLLNSLAHRSSIKPEGVSRLEISYIMYGMFVDMGVFGGKSLNESKESRTIDRLNGRKQKRRTKRQYQWYSKTMYGSISYLGYRMMKLYGMEAQNAVRLPELVEI